VEALAESRDLDEVIEIPVGRVPGESPQRGWVRLARRIGARPYDVVFDLAHNEIAQAITLLSRAPVRIALELLPSRIRRPRAYTDILSVDAGEVRRTHAVDLNNSLLEHAGVPTPARVPVLNVSSDLKHEAAAIVGAHRDAIGSPSGPTLLVHPGAGARARRWPAANFAYVADMAARRLGAHVILLDGPSDGGLAQEVQAAMAQPASLVRSAMSIPRLFGLFTQVDLLLCNDSGPMHMAAAVGTPVCALYGGQSRLTWGPLGSQRHSTFQAELPCGDACVAAGECAPTDPMRSFCVRRIHPEAVAAAVYGRLEALVGRIESTAFDRSRSSEDLEGAGAARPASSSDGLTGRIERQPGPATPIRDP
jgi:ADP-heptose:LPS heptosyltransferase